MVHFVGAGCGAADLITVRGARLLSEADVIIYAGSLVNPALLDYAKEGCEIHDSAYMTLEDVINVVKTAEAAGKTTVRLHTGDSSIYGAVREQFDELEKPLIFAVGNAPTALFSICDLIRAGKLSPEMVIGVPVGFVNVVEAKEELIRTAPHYVVARGRKGGSNVAAAIVNSVLYQMVQREE